MDLLNRCRGALLGLAAGDALGTTLEFSPPGTFAPITDMVPERWRSKLARLDTLESLARRLMKKDA